MECFSAQLIEKRKEGMFLIKSVVKRIDMS